MKKTFGILTAAALATLLFTETVFALPEAGYYADYTRQMAAHTQYADYVMDTAISVSPNPKEEGGSKIIDHGSYYEVEDWLMNKPLVYDLGLFSSMNIGKTIWLEEKSLKISGVENAKGLWNHPVWDALLTDDLGKARKTEFTLEDCGGNKCYVIFEPEESDGYKDQANIYEGPLYINKNATVSWYVYNPVTEHQDEVVSSFSDILNGLDGPDYYMSSPGRFYGTVKSFDENGYVTELRMSQAG